MNQFEQDALHRRNLSEGVELNAEAKEKQAEEAEKKMAAKERMEVTSKEIKNTKQQIQNIVANMQQVVKAVAAIRAQLQLVENDDVIPSVQSDQRTLEGLRHKLAGLFGEIKDLRVALLAEEQKSVAEDNKGWGAEDIIQEARRRVAIILMKLDLPGESNDY
ncbi:MAG: hypothetical protein EXS55_03945 [Candidatus Magasanikbacteria bacterium]|nr:hypothetical protein [Candidatus Magasanikbacteria bacterium]